MPSTTYTYSISADFPNGKVNTATLTTEIGQSPIIIALDRIDTSGNVLTIIFKDTLSTGDKTLLDNNTTGPAGGLIAAHNNAATVGIIPISFAKASGSPVFVNVDSDGNLFNINQPRSGTKFNIITHNWCDKTTWYSESTKVTLETLTDAGAGLSFNSAHAFWIDMKHGKVTDEDNICTLANKWLSTVTVNDVVKTESPPATTTGDYQIDYRTGVVTFNATQIGNTVKATYWYAGSGTFVFKPIAGKKIKLLSVEVQFSKDLELKDTLIFTPYGYAGVFAPQYVPVPYSATTLIPLAASNKYKRMSDFVNEANGSYPVIPVIGGQGWRGLSQEIITFPWNYVARTDLSSAAGMELKITMENNIEQGGQMATATFYALSESE
jgi:hypothetical protein